MKKFKKGDKVWIFTDLYSLHLAKGEIYGKSYGGCYGEFLDITIEQEGRTSFYDKRINHIYNSKKEALETHMKHLEQEIEPECYRVN